jgi:tetratricopeptide (TPR) repeat protein
MQPLCFVLMPFGKKLDGSGRLIDFDAVYEKLIAPAVVAAGLEPLRADEEITDGIIHKPMFERLILCEYAVADLTAANANVFYELGVRHAARPYSTVLIFSAGGSQLPFDVAPLRALPYQLAADGRPSAIDQDSKALAGKLREAAEARTDSPLFQLMENYPKIDHTKTDVFRAQVKYSEEMKKRLAAARKEGVAALRKIEVELGEVKKAESGVVVDLFLSYRAVKGWSEMADLVEKMSPPLAATLMIQEQLGLALNRMGKGEDAERVLTELVRTRGSSSETCGILGRVYKDRWEAALKSGDGLAAKGFLKKAVEAYAKGFEADWRDAYPGVNAVTLMEIMEPPDPRRLEILPVVAYAVLRKVAAGNPDYWDYATQLELAVLGRREEAASEALCNACAAVREKWEPETTARNLRLIREARERRGETLSWAQQAEEALQRRAAD